MGNYKVSVIICTYNSRYEEIIRTIYSVVVQKKISYEIIISDDGSNTFEKKRIEDYFSNIQFGDYTILNHTENQGTVLNFYDGVINATGEYIYVISPGDYLFDNTTLSDMYNFAIRNNANMCFGKANYYTYNNGIISVKVPLFPQWPNIYNEKKQNKLFTDIAFFSGQQPIGATYLRKREIILKYLDVIKGKIKYEEDFPTTAMYLLDGNYLYYYGRASVWYECSGGISTSGSDIWRKRLDKDEMVARDILLERYNDNSVLQAKYVMSKKERLRHPIICLIGIIIKFLSKIMYKAQKPDCKKIDILEQILSYQNM